MKTNKIELLLAHEDGTWTTEIVDIPAEIDREDANSVREWTMEKLWGLVLYRKIIFFGVYNTCPEAEGDDPRIERCVRCESILDEENPASGGRCPDETCPFSDTDQDDERGWIGHPSRPDTR